MNNNMDKLLKEALTPKDAPNDILNHQVLMKAKERKNMLHKKKISIAVAAAASTLLFASVTALAAYHYLSPAEVAEEIEDDTLKEAFSGDDTVMVGETQESGGYRITLLGSVAGKNISDYIAIDDTGIPEDDRIYTIVAIERVDGTPMPDTSSDEYGKESFYVSHYIHGLDPNEYSIMSMGGGYSEFVKDGVMYRVMEMDNIEIFADRGIYVGVNSGAFYDSEAYFYDENTGDITRNMAYEGVNALFVLPVDKSKADNAAAQTFLEELQASKNAPDMPMEMDEADMTVEAFMQKLTPENLNDYAEPIESTRQICKVDEDGFLLSEYELEDGSGGSFMADMETLFPDKKPGISGQFGYSYSETGLEDLQIEVYILNEDGTVTFVVYKPKQP